MVGRAHRWLKLRASTTESPRAPAFGTEMQVERYFFHVADGKDFRDLQGTELKDFTAARVEALRFAGALLAELGSDFWSGEEWSMRVTDAADLTLFTLAFTATSAPAGVTLGLGSPAKV